MTANDRGALVWQLIDHEGVRLRPYRCTSGKLTIGVGYNIADRGLAPLSRAIGRPLRIDGLVLTEAEAMRALEADIDRYEADVRERWPSYASLDGVRQRAVIDFTFNLGLAGAAKFVSAIRFVDAARSAEDPTLREACWTAVAFHIMDSVWARQVDDGLAGTRGRADRLAVMIRTGKDPGKR